MFDDELTNNLAQALASGAMSADDLALALTDVDPEAESAELERRRSIVSRLGVRLESLAQEQVQQRQNTEERWYKDVRQFNGLYEPGTFTDSEQYGSRLFVPLTRRLVGLVEARMFDILFPSDERCYVIEPTPVPDMSEALDLSEKLPADQPIDTPEGQMMAGALHGAIAAITAEAEKRCDAMQREIDDQLAESNWSTHARDVIHDAVLYGTGVIKGPVPMFRTTKRWTQQGETHVLTMERKPLPEVSRVDLWNFFPDMSATTGREAEFVFERHFMTRKELSELQDLPDVDLDALREVLDNDPQVPTGTHRERLRSLSGTSGVRDRRYEVWEYHGQIDADEIESLGIEVDGDSLKTHTGIVWFATGGKVLKAALNPLDTNELPYSVFTWQRDESSLFGFGLPYEVRDAQESANSAYRATHDNMGLSVMPQFIVDDSAVEPVNGHWGVEPGKFWRSKRPGADVRAAFQVIDINPRFAELQQIFSLSKMLIEEVGTLPAFLQGQDAPAAMQSATGASIAWTASNLWVRRAVRNWDDDIITPVITRFFDWNMQYSEKEGIKGDSRVRAQGVAALVELEGHAQRLSGFMQTASGMGIPPSNQLALLRQFARSFKLDPDKVLPSENELAKMKVAEQKAGPALSPEQVKMQVEKERMALDERLEASRQALRREEMASQERLMDMRMRLEIADAASKNNMTQEQAMAKYGYDLQRTQATLADKQADRDHKSQMLNAEMALKAQMGSGV